MTQPVLRAHEVEHLEAADVRHVEVEDDEVVRLEREQLDGLEAARRLREAELRLGREARDDHLADDLAVVESPKCPIKRQPVDVGAIARRIVEEHAPLGEAKRITVDLVAGDPAPVLGDPDRLGQVVTNLLGNAIKFTPEGGRVTVRVRAGGGRVELDVEDTGVGIPAALHARVFDRFARADSVRSATAGTGLGLTIVREIAAAHGGEVGLESDVGRGSRFWVRLPAQAATPAQGDLGRRDRDAPGALAARG